MRLKSLIILFSILVLGCSNNQVKEEKLVTIQEEREYLKKYGETLSLEEILEIAKERNLDLRIKGLEREIATLDKKISFGNFLPTITLGGSLYKIK